MSDEFYTPDEIAKRYKVSSATVYKWISEGHLKAIRLGLKTTRVPKEALDEFVKPVEPKRDER